MREPRTIRCAKCHIELSIRQFVGHRTGNGAPCERVACPVCGGPVGEDAGISHGMAVCSRLCQENLHAPRKFREPVREVDDQLAAMRRAEILPSIYQRGERAG
jgi:hypothetical protein